MVKWHNKFNKLDIIVDPDHPLSLGYDLRVVTDHVNFKGRKVSTDDMDRFLINHKTSQAMYCSWTDGSSDVIFIRGNMGGNNIGSLRLVELVTHEVSHLIDAILERCVVKSVDTELRAYLQDWFVGKILSRFDIFKEVSKC